MPGPWSSTVKTTDVAGYAARRGAGRPPVGGAAVFERVGQQVAECLAERSGIAEKGRQLLGDVENDLEAGGLEARPQLLERRLGELPRRHLFAAQRAS